MTPQETAALNRIRETFDGGARPGHLTEAIGALHRLRDGINQRDALTAKIRDITESASTGLIGADSAITQITELLERGDA